MKNNNQIVVMSVMLFMAGILGVTGYFDFPPYFPEETATLIYYAMIATGAFGLCTPLISGLLDNNNYKHLALNYDRVPFSGISLKNNSFSSEHCRYCKGKILPDEVACSRCGAPAE